MKYLISFACLLFLSISLSGQIAKGDDGLFYDEDGDLNEIQFYKNDLMHGKWESFNFKSVQLAEANYKKGKKHGKWLIWDDTGTLRYDMTYKKAERTGIWYIFDESGKLVSSKEYR